MAWLVVALTLAIVFGPRLWVRHVLSSSARPREDLPGTGGELARHLLGLARMGDIAVDETNTHDRYEPANKALWLTARVMHGRSLTAVAVAAHEVGHAMQHRIGYAPLQARTRLLRPARAAERAGAALLIAWPFIASLAPPPHITLTLLAGGIACLAIPIAVHLVTLPVELDASFRRAWPVLALGYIDEHDFPAVRRALFAQAIIPLTHAVATLFNPFAWIAALRR